MSTFRAARALLRDADALLIVDDGALRWVGRRAEIERWLDERGFTHRTARDISPEQYQDMCDRTSCESDRAALAGSGDCGRLCEMLERRGVDTLYVG